MQAPKSCSTCEHRINSRSGRAFWRCELSGFYTKVERDCLTQCGRNFEGWKPRIGFFHRIFKYFTGYKG